MESTFASVFISADDQAEAQFDMSEGYFTAALSADGLKPITHYWSTGYWFNDDLDKIVNTVTWPKTVKFGDPAAALASMGLQQCYTVEPLNEEPVEYATPTEP